MIGYFWRRTRFTIRSIRTALTVPGPGPSQRTQGLKAPGPPEFGARAWAAVARSPAAESSSRRLWQGPSPESECSESDGGPRTRPQQLDRTQLGTEKTGERRQATSRRSMRAEQAIDDLKLEPRF